MSSSSTSSSLSSLLEFKKKKVQVPEVPKVSQVSSTEKPEEAGEDQEGRKSSKEKFKFRFRKIKEEEVFNYAVFYDETNLHMPGLEAEPGSTGPPPSRACTSPGSPSTSGVMSLLPRGSRIGVKGGKENLHGNGRNFANGTLQEGSQSPTAATYCEQRSVQQGGREDDSSNL